MNHLIAKVVICFCAALLIMSCEDKGNEFNGDWQLLTSWSDSIPYTGFRIIGDSILVRDKYHYATSSRFKFEGDLLIIDSDFELDTIDLSLTDCTRDSTLVTDDSLEYVKEAMPVLHDYPLTDLDTDELLRPSSSIVVLHVYKNGDKLAINSEGSPYSINWNEIEQLLTSYDSPRKEATKPCLFIDRRVRLDELNKLYKHIARQANEVVLITKSEGPNMYHVIPVKLNMWHDEVFTPLYFMSRGLPVPALPSDFIKNKQQYLASGAIEIKIKDSAFDGIESYDEHQRYLISIDPSMSMTSYQRLLLRLGDAGLLDKENVLIDINEVPH